MFERRRRAMAAALAGMASMIYPRASHALRDGGWPGGPVTMVVPFPPGGPSDMVARLLAPRLSGLLGQKVGVRNMPGANGIVGMRYVASAQPDGHTVLYNTSSLVLSPHLYLDTGFDPIRDFDAISTTVSIPLVLLVHPSVPAADFRSFVAYATQRGGNLAYASASGGNVTHLAAVLLLQAMGMRAMHVSYRGSAPALAGLLAGQAQFMVNPVTDALGPIRDGRVRALAVTAKRRIAALPDVPTGAELGIPGFEVTAWHGVVAPGGTPAPVIDRWSGAVRQALACGDMPSQLARLGAQALGATPQDYAEYIRQEDARWRALIRAADIRPD